MFRRQPKNIFHAQTYPLLLDRYRARKIRSGNSCVIRKNYGM
jgi:hypothetical protein